MSLKMTQMLIRPILDADLEPLRQIFNAIVADGEAFTYETPFGVSEMRAYVDSYTAGGWVAELDGRVVGGYVLRPNQPGRGAHICNATYVVDASVRGQKLGRRLGEHSLVRAKELGFAAMQFNAVVSTNEAAVKLWTSLGFQIIGGAPEGFRRADGSRVALLILYRSL